MYFSKSWCHNIKYINFSFLTCFGSLFDMFVKHSWTLQIAVFLAGGDSTWIISAEDRAKHNAQFEQLKPVDGFVTGITL